MVQKVEKEEVFFLNCACGFILRWTPWPRLEFRQSDFDGWGYRSDVAFHPHRASVLCRLVHWWPRVKGIWRKAVVIKRVIPLERRYAMTNTCLAPDLHDKMFQEVFFGISSSAPPHIHTSTLDVIVWPLGFSFMQNHTSPLSLAGIGKIFQENKRKSWMLRVCLLFFSFFSTSRLMELPEAG